MEPITITLTSYNLKEAQEAVIRACIEDCNKKGGKSQKEISELFGVEPSTVSNWIRIYNINWKSAPTKVDKKFKEFERYLEKKGLTIVPKADVIKLES